MRRAIVRCVMLGFVAVMSDVAFAQTVRTWTGGAAGAGTVFTTATNWLGGVAPASGEMARFNGSAAGPLSLTFSAAVGGASGLFLDLTSGQVANLTVNNSNASAQTFRLGSGTSAIAAGAGAFTLGASGTANPITLALGAGTGTTQYAFLNNSANTATIGQNVSVARGGTSGERDLVLGGTGAWSIQGSLGGSNTDVALVVNGASVTLSGSNSYALGTTVSAGSLILSGSATLGAAANALTVSGGLLDLGASGQSVGVATLAGGTIANGTLTPSSVAAQSGLVSASLAGAGAFTKSTAGTVTLSGSSTLSGGVAVQDGSLVLAAGTNRLPVASAVTVGTGSTTGKLVLGNGSGRSNQTLASLTASGLGGSVVGGNASASTLTVTAASGTVSFAGTLGGAGANENSLVLGKDGAVVLVLSGSNTFSGGVDFARGTIQLGNDAALGSGTLTFLTNANAKRMRSDGVSGRTIANAVSLGSDARLGDAGTGGLVFTGNWNGGANAKTLTVDSNVELRGDFTKTTAAVTKDGAATLLFSGTASSFANALVVSTGTVSITGLLGTGTAASVSIGGGAYLVGTGRVGGQVAGSGRMAPGSASAAGIFTADSLLGTGSASTAFTFQLSGTGSPAWNAATNSGNDVLRLSSATAPFAGSLTASKVIDIYFGAGTGTFQGAFFTDLSGDFSTSIASATYQYYTPGDGNGPYSYRGANYYALASSNVTISTVNVPTANFADGSVTNGQVAQFIVVPEPATCTVALSIGALAAAVIRRRR